MNPIPRITIKIKTLLIIAFIFLFVPISFSQKNEKKRNQDVLIANEVHASETQKKTRFSIVPFGSGGQVKMIYDRRHQPQAVFMNNKINIVYNGGAVRGEEKTYPFVLTFDPKKALFTSPVQLGDKGSKDHHYCPIIWADNNNFLHVLSGNHSTAGTHLISKKKADIGENFEDWTELPQIRHSLSYPTVYNIYDNKKLIYFRTGEHRSSWTYLISGDEGKTWSGPENDVVDLNMGGETQPENNKPGIEEWSSYQTCLPSKDGKYLHVTFCYYDDNKKSIPEKFYNPRYQTKKNLDFKYNLYYVKINLQTNEVENFNGETVKTPIGLENANAKCKIWDTAWRGAGIPPQIIIDENNNPAFLHVLSENTPEEFNYYYVKFDNGEWKKTVITSSNHYWNNGFLWLDKNGVLHAYLIVGNNLSVKLTEGFKNMDDYGGGNIEEWQSYDKGNTWKKIQDLTPKNAEFAGWKYNNIQAVTDSKGNIIDGMFLFYGWKNIKEREARGFLKYDIKN